MFERRFAGGKRFATDDGKRDDSPWCPTKRRKVEGKRWNRSEATSVSLYCLVPNETMFFLPLHSSSTSSEEYGE